MPTVLLPYQQKWISDESPVKVCVKSRRIGLSWCEAADSALSASSSKGMDVFYVGYNKDMAEEFIEDCAFWAKNYQLVASEIEQEIFRDERKDILTFKIRFSSGFKILALSSRPSNLRGRQGKAIIDEAAFHEDLPELLKAANAFLMWGGKVVVISSHNGNESSFNELVTDITAGKLPYSLHNITLDDALRQGLYKRICLSTNQEYSLENERVWRDALIKFYGDGADEELFCIPRHSGGAYFSRMVIESVMVDLPVIRYSLTSDFALLPDIARQNQTHQWLKDNIFPLLENISGNCYLGFDFARSGDLSVLMVANEKQDLVRETFLTLEMRNIPFKQQEQILFSICDRLPRFSGGAIDARGNGHYIAEVMGMRYRGKISEIQITEKWYQEAFPKYKASMEDKNIRLPKNSDILADHRMVIYEKGKVKIPDKRIRGIDGGFRHGDSAVAGCLLWWASCQNTQPIFSADFGML
jgi:phage FluMu gp28-like protein